jgi:hypothetical protein
VPTVLEVETMKRLLSGVAFAALIAAPVWAQTPNNNQNNPSNPNAGNPPATAQAPAASQNDQGVDKSNAPTRKEAAAPKTGKHHAMRHGRHMTRHMAKAGHARHMQTANWRQGRRMHAMWHSGTPRHGMYREYSWNRPHRMYSSWGWGGGWGWGPKHASTDFMAEQLNRQQLGGGVGYGTSMPAGPQPYGRMGY